MEPESELEQHLLDVPVPEDLLAQLRQIPAQQAALDQQLAQVEVPDELAVRLHAMVRQPIAVRRRRGPSAANRSAAKQSPRLAPLAFWATAASLLLAFAVGWGLWSLNDRSTQQHVDNLVRLDGDSETFKRDGLAATSEAELTWLGLTPEEMEQRSAISQHLLTRPEEIPRDAIPLEWTAWSHSSLAAPLETTPPPRSLAEELPDDLMANTFLMQWQPLGANPLISERQPLPELPWAPESPVFYFPNARSYDRDFLLREAAHPFTRPQSAGLSETGVPVAVSQESFDQTVFATHPFAQDRVEAARTEEWLAATGKFFVPAQPRQLEIRTAAGPAVFAPAGTHMLQIGVVAGSTDPEDRPPAHITIAVTPPASTEQARRTWQPLRIAIREMVERLGPYDTLSVVVMAEYPYVLVEDVTPENREALFLALDRVTADAAPHLAEGIRLSAATAFSKPGFGDIRRPLLIFSDQLSELDLATARQIRPLVESAQQEGIGFTWIQQEDERYASIASPPPPLAGIGRWVVTNSLQSIGRLLDEAMHDQSSLVGRNPVIEVKWKDKAVEQYRLIGYQPAGGAMLPAAPTRSLHAHESGTLLFELTLPEEGPNDVAQVVLTWEAESGEPRTSTQTVSRLQFAPSWQTSALSLQAAQLTAQSLALSQNAYYVRRRGNTLDEWETWFSSLSPAFQKHASFPRLQLLLREAVD